MIYLIMFFVLPFVMYIGVHLRPVGLRAVVIIGSWVGMIICGVLGIGWVLEKMILWVMKSNKEILELMLENQHLFRRGLCAWSSEMYYKDIIDNDERYSVRRYIKDNPPRNLYHMINGAFYWRPDRISPRIKWIKKHIKKLSVWKTSRRYQQSNSSATVLYV